MSFVVKGAKDPNVTATYQFDWTEFFVENDDTLDSATLSIVDQTSTTVDLASDLVIVAQSQTAAGIVTVWLSGGTAGLRYYLRCRIAGARTSPAQVTDEETIVIPVRQT